MEPEPDDEFCSCSQRLTSHLCFAGPPLATLHNLLRVLLGALLAIWLILRSVRCWWSLVCLAAKAVPMLGAFARQLALVM